MTVTFPAGFLKSYSSQKFVVFSFQSVALSVNINQIVEVLRYSASSSHVRRSLSLRCVSQIERFPYFSQNSNTIRAEITVQVYRTIHKFSFIFFQTLSSNISPTPNEISPTLISTPFLFPFTMYL